MTFLKSIKTMFVGQEIEITVKSLETKGDKPFDMQSRLLEMVSQNRSNAPVIALDIDIRNLID